MRRLDHRHRFQGITYLYLAISEEVLCFRKQPMKSMGVKLALELLLVILLQVLSLQRLEILLVFLKALLLPHPCRFVQIAFLVHVEGLLHLPALDHRHEVKFLLSHKRYLLLCLVLVVEDDQNNSRSEEDECDVDEWEEVARVKQVISGQDDEKEEKESNKIQVSGPDFDFIQIYTLYTEKVRINTLKRPSKTQDHSCPHHLRKHHQTQSQFAAAPRNFEADSHDYMSQLIIIYFTKQESKQRKATARQSWYYSQSCMQAMRQAYFYLFLGRSGYNLLSFAYWLGLSSIFIDNQYQLLHDLCQHNHQHKEDIKSITQRLRQQYEQHIRTDQGRILSQKESLLFEDFSDQSSSRCYKLGNYILIMLLRNIQKIKGLKYIKDFITDSEKQQILAVINNNRWCDRLRRRQQYYGIKYFQTKVEDQVLQPKHSTDHYPIQQLQFLVDKSVNSCIFEPQNPPNQILVNRYLRHDKLGLHVEDTQAFGEIIMGVSLGSTEYLRLVNVNNPQLAFMLELEDKSSYVLSQQARYNYRHGIGRVKDNERYKIDGFERISLTVRHVIETRRKIDGEKAY